MLDFRKPRAPDMRDSSAQRGILGLYAAVTLLSLIIFSADVLLPLGVAVPMAYVGPVLLTLWLPRRASTLMAAGVCTTLTVIGIFASPSGGVLWMGMVNRGLAVAVQWLTTALILLHKSAAESIRTLRRWLAVCASCKKIRDDQGFWQGLEQYVEDNSQIQFTHSLCPSCTEKWYPELYPQLVERHPEMYKELL